MSEIGDGHDVNPQQTSKKEPRHEIFSDVKTSIETQVLKQTGRALRNPIKLAYFSLHRREFPGPKTSASECGIKGSALVHRHAHLLAPRHETR